jgi:hypothetical protein
VIDRRTFLAGTGAVLLTTPLAAEAQQAKIPRIGVLSPGSPGPSPLLNAFQPGSLIVAMSCIRPEHRGQRRKSSSKTRDAAEAHSEQ